ncbi:MULTISPECIES: cupin domain-containing protein [unclassified Sphingomonas]|uniref:cupin domain-containing protein n=1 Tax=unclassified Sphingomonas TaxID=196159 RepID=UPI0006F7E829|nr:MULTISPECIES: cupin domain-containing protein [unclassified Sphingomonas]KQX17580.1 transcriptional regulator [Sphingomonas sp. Root1294]KQY70507.1 transcriptional regulator [Sphingomonas sp. Root50]KRB92007.1 transcriptional regulator [Sphingomonas sp. Root720]
MPKIDLAAIPQTNATGYPPEYADVVRGRWYRRLAPAGGLADYGVSHVTLKPGGWSAQRHWHEGEDEFVVMLSGHAVLVDDAGRTPMGPGDCAAFPKNDGNGHCLVNESDADCSYIAVGRPAQSDCHYPDIDMHLDATRGRQVRKDGSEF